MIEAKRMPEARLFEHEAMHTTFSLRLVGEEEQVARGMAREAFTLLDELEGKLSARHFGGGAARYCGGFLEGRTRATRICED